MLLHLALAAAASLCLLAGWWQFNRAVSGNLLSYGYAVEWPVFAVMAGYFWWQLIHDHPNGAAAGSSPPGSVPHRPNSPHQPGRQHEDEDPLLQAYNDDLCGLAARGRPKTWRNPKGMP